MSPVLNDATAVYAGATAATAVYAGATKIWPAAPATPTYNLFPGTPVPVDSAVEATDFVFATEFWVTKAGCFVTKVRYLQPTVGGLAARTVALYSTTNGNTGTKVGGDWTLTPSAAGQWCTYTLPSRIALTANLHYRIAVRHPSNQGFPRTFDYFQSGGSTTFGGYLVRPQQGQALNTCQGSFTTGAMAFPTQAYRYSAYFSDVEVVDA